MSNFDYRELTQSDAEAVVELRCSVLKSDPDTFSISIDEENSGSIYILKEVLATYHKAHDRIIVGAFGDTLVGMIGVERFQGDYTRHKARIWGLYVVQAYRNAGIATALIAQSISFVKQLGGVEKINLDVTSAATDAFVCDS